MKKIFIIVIASIFYFSNAFAVTLLDALNQTYKNNIQLNAERENIKASEEDVNIAKADYKPSLTLSGSKSIENTNKLTNQSGGDATTNDVDPFSTSIKLEQKLLDYGRDLALEKNLTALDLARAKLVKKEQEILHDAIYAFTNLILARETLNINAKNLNLLIRQVENDKIANNDAHEEENVVDEGLLSITDRVHHVRPTFEGNSLENIHHRKKHIVEGVSVRRGVAHILTRCL